MLLLSIFRCLRTSPRTGNDLDRASPHLPITPKTARTAASPEQQSKFREAALGHEIFRVFNPCGAVAASPKLQASCRSARRPPRWPRCECRLSAVADLGVHARHDLVDFKLEHRCRPSPDFGSLYALHRPSARMISTRISGASHGARAAPRRSALLDWIVDVAHQDRAPGFNLMSLPGSPVPKGTKMT